MTDLLILSHFKLCALLASCEYSEREGCLVLWSIAYGFRSSCLLNQAAVSQRVRDWLTFIAQLHLTLG